MTNEKYTIQQPTNNKVIKSIKKNQIYRLLILDFLDISFRS